MSGPPRLAARLVAAMGLVLLVGGISLVLTVTIVAPRLFHLHLSHAGVTDTPLVAHHAEEAFFSSFEIALFVAMVVSLLAASLVSLFLVRRIAHPVEALAEAAEAVAEGDYDVDVPDGGFSSEVAQLTESFTNMAGRLAETERSRTRLLADLAHEIRTPLATLEAYMDGLEDGVVTAQPDTYEIMRAQVLRLRRLTVDLRESAAAAEHALHLVPVDLAAGEMVAEAVSAAVPRYAAKPLELTSEPGPSGLVVHADPHRLQQVLANLLDNALRHTPAGGHVVVSVLDEGRWVAFVVADDGEGIPADQLDAVFERFHRVDPARSSGDGAGSGLGLTIARAIAVDHGGSLTASSPGPGQGSTFTLRLPRAGGSRTPA